MGEMRGGYKILVGKPERKRTHGRTRHRREDNIRIDLRELVKEVWTGCIWLRIGISGRLL
jgi:hypothetical protein